MKLFNRFWPVFFTTLMLMIAGSIQQRAYAQYFGQNKVKYKHFKFEILKTKHFDIYFYPEEKKAVEQAARLSERWYARYSKILNHHLTGRQPLIIYSSHPEFEQTNAISGMLGQGTGGVTEPLKRRIVLPFAGTLAGTNHVIGHELVHAFQFDITGQKGGRTAFRTPTAAKLPLWFIEGMAEFLSIGPEDPNTTMWMRDAVKYKKKLPTIHQLANSYKYFPYRFGQAVLAYIAGRWGDDKIGNLLQAAGKSGDIEKAIKQVLGVTPDTLSISWHKALHAAYDPLIKVTKSPADYGHLLLSEKHSGGSINVGPVLSPDGKKLIFFSEKNLFAIDLFMADALTGKVERTIVRTEMDPHFGNLEFINGAGTWNSQGTQFAFSTIVKGSPSLMIMDVKKNHLVKKIRFPDLGEVFGLTWAPDDHNIVFSSLTGGFINLFCYNLKTDSLSKITDDAYADLQPAWSPDGKYIAFVTDRFSTDMDNLNPGNYRLALLNVQTGDIQPLPSFPSGKNINPQWSPDGKNIYFISDQNGISNIYRLELATGKLFQLTNFYTGVTGITSLSPALSVARENGRLVYCAFENEKYNIYSIDTQEILSGKLIEGLKALSIPSISYNLSMLPPVKQTGGELLALLHNPTFGLPETSKSYKITSYHPKFSLDYVGQPMLAAGVDRFGVQLGGGVSMFWSDMLGNHGLSTMLQMQSYENVTDISAFFGYQNSSRRWNWGGTIQQIPYVLSQYATGYTIIDSMLVYEEIMYRFRQTNRQISGFVSYPFSKAQRIEFYGGFKRISFDERIITNLYDPYSGAQILAHTKKLPSLPALNLFTSSAAMVYDNSFFGATSPLLGQRYRMELSSIIGSISFFTFLADYRRYIMPVRPFTLALRFLHYGRYGRDAEDNRMTPLFIGYPSFVRGYDSNSFSSSECKLSATDQCPVFDNLLGSKMTVANIELRFPFFGALKLGKGYYGILPIETGVFYDAGVAWTKNQELWFVKGGNRKLSRSYGATIRINLMGYAILEIDYVNPVNRPHKGWFWQFNLIPGF